MTDSVNQPLSPSRARSIGGVPGNTTEYGGKVRSRDPESSWDAAALQSRPRESAVKAAILSILYRFGPLSDEQLFDRYEAESFFDPDVPKATAQNVRTRRKALELEGKVIATGNRVPTRAGSTAMQWRRTP